jgi:predicted flap endonuclease-1-like 5' DNA nuclease
MARLAYFLLGVLLGWWLYEVLREWAQTPLPVEQSHSPRASAPAPKRETAQAPVVIPDDLTRITGIGPVAARALNDIGIWTFAQLAAESEESLVRRLPSRVGTRVGRDKWIEQAKKLSKP